MANEVKKGGTITLIKIAFRNIGRNGRRTAFCLCSIGFAVLIIPVLGAVVDGMGKAIDDLVIAFDMGQVNVVSKQYEAEKEFKPVQYPVADGKNWKEVAQEIKSAVGGLSGGLTVLPRISTIATLQESTIKHAVLWGVDIEQEKRIHHLNMTKHNDGLVKGRWPANANECAVGTAFERKSGLTIGDTIPLKTISAQFSDRYWSPQITGIFNFDYIVMDESYIIADHDRLQRLLGLGEGTQSLFIFAEDKNLSGGIAKEAQKQLGDDHVVSDWKDSPYVALMKVAVPIYTSVFLIFLIVASFLICNTVVMIVHERIKEIGMMGALGMSRAEIVRVFFFESVFLAVIGSAIGVFLAGCLTAVLQNFPINMGDFLGNKAPNMPVTSSIFFVFSFARLAQGFLMGVIVASIFTLIPSLRSAKVEPVEALRR